MNKDTNNKQYDLEDRCYQFAKSVRFFIKDLKKSIVNLEDCKQVLRSSGSIGANYIEANEALSKKDFLMRIKISRKEAKESRYWLNLIQETLEQSSLNSSLNSLIQESNELLKIFSSIYTKSS